MNFKKQFYRINVNYLVDIIEIFMEQKTMVIIKIHYKFGHLLNKYFRGTTSWRMNFFYFFCVSP